MNREFDGYAFRFVCRIEPERDVKGGIIEFMPQSRYRNAKKLRGSIVTVADPSVSFEYLATSCTQGFTC
jgi:hypothetical protein